MSTTCIVIIGAISTIVAAFGGAALGAYFAYKTGMKLVQRQQFFTAATKFKATIIYELIGFYPIDQYWEEKNFPRLYQSIPRIKSVAVEFRFFVKSKDDFDSSVKDYDEYCRKTHFNEITADMRYPQYRKEGEAGKREQFKNIVDHLISFANEK